MTVVVIVVVVVVGLLPDTVLTQGNSKVGHGQVDHAPKFFPAVLVEPT